MSPEQVKNQVRAQLQMAKVVGEAIQELESVPSGTLYAMVQDVMPYWLYNQTVGMLVAAGLVANDNHLLRWVGDGQ